MADLKRTTEQTERESRSAPARTSDENVGRPLRVLVVTTAWPGENNRIECIFVTQQTEFLRHEGVDVDVFAFEGRSNPIRYLIARRRLRRQLRNGGYDLIHAHFGQSAALALPAPIPLVATFHGCDLIGVIGRRGRRSIRGRILRRLTRFASRHADRVVLVSASMAEHLPSGTRYDVVPMGVDTNVFRREDKAFARSALGLHATRRYVLFVGNPNDARKRFWLAQEAVKLLPPTMDVELLCAWEVSREVVARFMNAADALVVTSIHEGGPLVSKEALACGLPVVSLNVGDAEQLLDRLESCVLVADDKASTIAAGLTEVLREPRRVDERALERVDDRTFVKQLIGLYEEALSSRTA